MKLLLTDVSPLSLTFDYYMIFNFMKKNFLVILSAILLVQPIPAHAQQKSANRSTMPNVVLAGQISNYSNHRYFYYSNSLHSKVDTTQKVYVKNGNTYTFDLSKTSASNRTADMLYFSWELSKEGTIDECNAAINIAAIRYHCRENKLKNMKLQNDFNLDVNCEVAASETFSAEQLELGGNYKMTVNDTVYFLNLSTYALSTFTGDYSPRDKNFCNKIWGWWGYKDQKKELGISIDYYMNKDWGIYINSNQRFSFIVTKDGSNKPVFKSINANVVLEKL